MNTTKLAENYIAEHPSVKDCLGKGLINYSALSREIAKELNITKKTSFDAILIACRRYKEKIEKDKLLEDKILNILKNSKLEIKNKIVVVVVEKNIFFDNLLELEKTIKKESFHVIHGSNSITIITSQEFMDDIKRLFKNKILKINKDLVEIIIKSPQDIETTSGVMAYLYSLFGEHGVNIAETMSCWTDTLFVVEENDIAKVMEILRF